MKKLLRDRSIFQDQRGLGLSSMIALGFIAAIVLVVIIAVIAYFVSQ